MVLASSKDMLSKLKILYESPKYHLEYFLREQSVCHSALSWRMADTPFLRGRSLNAIQPAFFFTNDVVDDHPRGEVLKYFQLFLLFTCAYRGLDLI